MKSFFKKLFISATLMPMVVHGANKQSYSPPLFLDTDRLNKIKMVLPKIDKLYQVYAEKNHFAGYAFGIIVDGKLIHSNSGGYINLEKKIPATSNSMFRVASMTKSFTAMAILKLRDEGKLRLDEPAYLYVPELKNQQITEDTPEITIKDLLIHAAGFPQDDPWGDRKLHISKKEFSKLLHNISFSNPAEITYEYSNLGYAILGQIITKASGMPYQVYIKKNILGPLNMKDTAWDYTDIPPSQLAHGYRWIDSQWQEQPLLQDGVFGAMGGLIASVESFSHYIALHQAAWPARSDGDAGPIKRSSIREMHHPWNFVEFSDDEEAKTCIVTAYGYGLKWMKDCKSKTYVGHSGGLPGFGSNWFFMPEYGVAVVLLANETYAPAYKINQQVLKVLVEEAKLQPRQLPISPILKQRSEQLIKLLPEWQDAKTSEIFADNFFLDYSIDKLKQESIALFKAVGKVNKIHECLPTNQLRGYCMIDAENGKLKISLTLSPENPARIQSYKIEKL